MDTEWTDELRVQFVELLAETGCVVEAASRLGVAWQDAIDQEDEIYEEWQQAEEEAEEALFAEARRRAMEVIDRPLIYRGQPILRDDGTPWTVRRYNDGMMLLTLALIDGWW